MKTRKILSPTKRFVIGAVSLVVLIGVVALLPGKIEGQYRDVGVRCMCDCVNFLQFRDGKIIHYGSSHPPAKIIGRYTTESDGKIAMYYASYADDVPEELIGHAYPHFLITRFSWVTNGDWEWGIKRPKILAIRQTIMNHDITTAYINADRSITTTFYDSSLQPVREEFKRPKRKEQEGRTSRDAPTGHKLFIFYSKTLQSRRWAHIKRCPRIP